MKKLYLIFGFFILALAGVSYVYYTSWRNEAQDAHAIPAIPQSAALVYPIDALGKQWDDLQQITLSKDLSHLPVYAGIQTSLEWLAGLGLPRSTVETMGLTVSIHGLAEENPDYIFYFPLHHPATQELGKLLLQTQQNAAYQLEENQYNKHKITTIRKDAHAQPIHFIKKGNHLVASTALLLLEDLIRGATKKEPNAFLSTQFFANKPGSVYINFSQLPSLLRIFLNKDAVANWETSLPRFASAAQVEMKLTNHHILFNGFVYNTDTTQVQQINTFVGQPVGTFDLAHYIPNNTAWVQHYAFKDAQSFMSAWQPYRTQENPSTASPHHTGILTPASLHDMLNPLLNGEMSLCDVGSTQPEKVLLLRTHHPEAFITALEETQLIQKTLYNFPKRTTPVYTVATHALKTWLPGMVFATFQPRLLTTIDQYIVLADSKAALEKVAKSNNQGQTWVNSPTQKAFLSSLLDQAHYSVLINLEQAWPKLTQALKPNWQAWLAKQGVSLKNFKNASLQVVPDPQDTNSSYISLVVEHHANKQPAGVHEKQDVSGLHAFKADAPLITRPFVVPTHKPEGTLVLFQDALNQVYCMDTKGNLLWKNTLKSPIVGNIFVVDFYKNNRCQYLWITHDAIHLTDYYGRPVSNYPHPLPVANTAFRLQVVDYQQDKNYRFLLADNKGNIYLKDSHYRPLPGWNPNALGHAFAHTPFHVRLKNDYFLGLHQDGLLQAIGRNRKAFNGFPIDLKAPIHNPLLVKKGNTLTNTSLITLTDDGLLSHHSLTGSLQDSIQLEKPTASTQFILCANEGSNQGYCMVRQDLDKFACLDEGGQLLFEKNYASVQPLLHQYYDFNTHQFYVMTDQGKQVSYIYDRQGHLMHTAPLPNSQPLKLILHTSQAQLTVYSSYKEQAVQYVLPLEANN